MTLVFRPDGDLSCPPIVWQVETDTPADKAGIRPGDRLLAVDNHGLKDLKNREISFALLHTQSRSPAVFKLEGEHGVYTVTVERMRASELLRRQGWKIGPDDALFPLDATDAEIKRVSEMGPAPPADHCVFPTTHYPSNTDLYYPGFEVFVWEDKPLVTVGGIEKGPAMRSGVHYGDVIVSVNGVNPLGKTVAQLESMFSSVSPRSMTLKVDRDGVIKSFTFALEKAADVLRDNKKRSYKGKIIPSVVPETYLRCFEPKSLPQ